MKFVSSLLFLVILCQLLNAQNKYTEKLETLYEQKKFNEIIDYKKNKKKVFTHL